MADAFDDTHTVSAKADSLRVAVRVRPLNAREQSQAINSKYSWKVDASSVAQHYDAKPVQQNIFTFDSVFDQQSTNSQIFDAVAAPVVKSTIDGINGTIFAYGQTAAGKTYTMLGTEADPGVTRRAIAAVFERVQAENGRQFLLRASYIEIYNEIIRDLLVPGNDNLRIHEDTVNKRVFVDAKEEVVVSVDEVMAIIAAGETARAVGETNMNERSSRSHTIFSLKIESREMEADAEHDQLSVQNNGVAVRASTLSLVDLAGSERASFTKAQGQRLIEGGHINKSLLTLGTVINKLSSGVSLTSGHIPYRDSKLTRLLQPALGGNARTSVICAVTPSVLHMDETISTLKFASRAKKVTNMAKANEYLDDRAKLRKAEKKIAVLRAEVQALRRIGGSSGRNANDFARSSDASNQADKEERIHHFQKVMDRIFEKASSQERIHFRHSDGQERAHAKEYKRPSLSEALDLCIAGSRESTEDRHDDKVDRELQDLRKKMMFAEKDKRQALSEIEYERQAMAEELQHLVASSEEATMGRIAAEQDSERAISTLARAQARSLVDEIVSEAMTTSIISKDLTDAQKQLVKLDAICQENKTVKGNLTNLRKEHAETVRREKRGIGPVLKEAKNAQNRLHDTENKLKATKQSMQRITSEKSALEREIKDRDRKIKVLMAEVERHRKHDEKVQNRINREVSEEKKKFDATLGKVREELTQSQDKVKGLEGDVRKQREQAETLKARGEENVKTISANEEKIQDLLEKISRNEEEMREATLDSERCTNELQEKLRCLECERNDVEEARNKLEKENDNRAANAAKKTEELGRVSLELEETRSELEGVRRTLEESIKREEEVVKSTEEASRRWTAAQEENNQLRNEIEEQANSLEDARLELRTAQSRLEEMAGLEDSLASEQKSRLSLNKQLSEAHAAEQHANDRTRRLETELKERTTAVRNVENELAACKRERKCFESAAENANAKHQEVLRIVEELERVNRDVARRKCEKCCQLQKQIRALQCEHETLREKWGDAGRGVEEVSNLRDENRKLNELVEELTTETATRMREMLRLTKTLRTRDDQLFRTEETLNGLRRGEGVIGKLEERVARRDTQLDELKRRLLAQEQLLARDGLTHEYEVLGRTCAMESELTSLKAMNERLRDRMHGLEMERENVREETFKLRDKIKERDCRRIEKALERKEEGVTQVKQGGRRWGALREVAANEVRRNEVRRNEGMDPKSQTAHDIRDK